jgi:prepilin-type N-terminal cleavage/methylation domain-containing protein
MEKQNLMELLKAKIYDKQGMTLIEVLLVVVILAIITPVVISAFTAGQKTFVKQSSEVQFREDADYVSTMIMNEFFSVPLDYIKSCGSNCILLEKFTEVNISEFEGDDANKYYKIESKEIIGSLSNDTIMIKFDDLDQKKQVKITTFKNGKTNETVLETESDFTGSTIGYKCGETESETNPCKTGTILLDFLLSNKQTTQSLELESRFGF